MTLFAFSQALKQANEAGVYDIHTTAGLMSINGEITRQAATLAYLQDFRLMMFITLSALPLIFLLRVVKNKKPSAETNAAALE